jgi:ribonucleoside-diphosphate reductase alpha chain
MSKPAPEVAPVAVEEMSSEEYRAMIELENAGPDDCEMCGS